MEDVVATVIGLLLVLVGKKDRTVIAKRMNSTGNKVR
jgi:hypothetical protein